VKPVAAKLVRQRKEVTTAALGEATVSAFEDL
jgi:hypothetical protein